jgi:hypothetical protein
MRLVEVRGLPGLKIQTLRQAQGRLATAFGAKIENKPLAIPTAEVGL